MLRKKISFAPECESCEDYGEYEQMTLGPDNEPRYWMQRCVCTVEGRGVVSINVLGLLQDLRLRANVIEDLYNIPARNTVQSHGHVLSTTLPDVRMAF